MSEKQDLKKLEEKILSLEKSIESLHENESRLIKENSELKEIKKYFDVLMQNTEDYILVCDRDGIPQAFNAAYKEVVENLLGIEMKPGVQPFEISDKAIAKSYWKSLQKKALSGEKFKSEYSDPDRAGYFETIFCPVMEGEEVTGFTEITRNITDRKMAEKALEESDSFRSSLLENAPIVIIVYDPDTSIMYVNSLFEKLTGFSKKEAEGVKAPYPWWIDDPEYGTVEERKKTILDGVSGSERRFKKKNGEDSWVEVNTSPIYYNGELKYILAMWIDVSERKKAERETKILQEKLQRSQTMESLGLLAGGVAHDLNNVLAGIVSYPDLLLINLPPDSNLRKPLLTIKDAGDRATAIVRDLLTIARGVATNKNSLSLNSVINDYLESPEFEKLRQYHPAVIIETNLDSDLFNVKGSYIHLRKALMNLISNASEAIDGKGYITISTRNCFLDTPLKAYEHVKIGEYAVLSVADNGSGITSNDLKRIFEPFYTKKVMGRSGTGLGLAVVWNVVREHNGYINVISDKKGSIFELYFPITRENLSGRDVETPLEDIKGNGQKILIVDDVEDQRNICGKILETLGYKTAFAASGEEAVRYLEQNGVDLVLMDMIMDPGINGRETYERILKIHPRQKVVIISGYVETEEVKKTRKLGAGPLVKKPFTLQQLGIAIKEELKK